MRTNTSDSIQGYRFNQNGMALLGPDTQDLTAWSELLGAPYPGQNLIALATGSLARFTRQFPALVADQELETSNLAVVAAASCTPADLVELKELERTQQWWLRRSKGRPLARDAYHPPRHRLITREVGRLSAHGGNGGQPKRALELLLTDPTVAEDLEELVSQTVMSFRDYKATSCNLLSLEGAGGTAPLHQYARQVLMDTIRVNLDYRVLFLPSPEQALNVRNARANLGHLMEQETPDRSLCFLVPLDRIGEHPWDAALAAGLLTLTGTKVGGGEHDAVTMFRLLKRHGDFVLARPRVVEVPLSIIGTRVLRWGPQHRVNLPDRLGGRHVLNTIAALRELVLEAPQAYHLAVVAGAFEDQDVPRIKRAVQAFLPAGQTLCVVNRMWPTVAGNSANYFVCDFQVAREVPAPAVALLNHREPEAHCHGLSREELAGAAASITGTAEVREIEEALARIRQVRRR